MKKLLALSLCALLLAGCTAAYDGPTETVWALTELETTHYSTYNDSTMVNRTTSAYDVCGNLIRSCVYYEGELESETKMKYDDRGNLVSEVVWDHGGFLPYPTSRTSYTYDEQNRPLTITYRNGFGFRTGCDEYVYDDEAGTILWDGTYDTQTTYLNENGSPLRVLTYTKVSGSSFETLYEYDAQGRAVKWSTHSDGGSDSSGETAYDDQGRIAETKTFDADGTLLSRNTFTYGENTTTEVRMGGYTIVTTCHPDGRVEKIEHFDEDGNLAILQQYTYQEIQIRAKEE